MPPSSRLAILTLAVMLPSPARAEPDTARYVVLNHGRTAGEMTVASTGDTVVVRYQYVDRNRGPRIQTRYRFGPGRTLLAAETGGISADLFPVDVGERVEVVGAMTRWRSPVDSGEVATRPGLWYWPRGATPWDAALLARHLLSLPGRAAPLLPAGQATVSIAADTSIEQAAGREHVRLVLIEGLGLSPEAVWLDDRDQLFASGTGWFATIREDWEGQLATLRRIEHTERARRSEAVARRLTPQPLARLAIRNGDLFDSQQGVVRPRMTILIEADRITAVGPADSVRVPAGATIVDATGKTVIPGLWDMHTHLGVDEEGGLMQLAAGITTVRDVASDIDEALSYRERVAAGTRLGPRMILAGFMEGPGRWAGPSDVQVRTEAEAAAWIARYDSLGYRQIKLYNLVHPDLLPTIAAETRRRGMRLSGHVLRGLSVPAAVQLGYDEIQHAAFLFSTFFQDSLYLPRMRAYSAVAAAVAPTFDVNAAEVTSLIGFLRERGTVIDGTFNIWQDRSRLLADGTDPVFGPTLAWLPPLTRRGLTVAPPATPQDGARAEAASSAYRGMLKRLYDAGVTLVPGTDNVPGLSLHGELEVYQRAGIPAAAVLQIATIASARVMKDDRDHGSVAPGKVADLAIVAGRPAERITDLRKTEQVVRAGKLYRSVDLYRAVGINPGNETGPEAQRRRP